MGDPRQGTLHVHDLEASEQWAWERLAPPHQMIKTVLSDQMGRKQPKTVYSSLFKFRRGSYPPYRFEIYLRVREDPERYSEETLTESGHELPLSDEIYDSLLCFTLKNYAGSHPFKFKSTAWLLHFFTPKSVRAPGPVWDSRWARCMNTLFPDQDALCSCCCWQLFLSIGAAACELTKKNQKKYDDSKWLDRTIATGNV